ncbi:pilus assembly PilX N-terminal domain-containing protein [Paenibacillus aquistagni]|uniref:pilus assembly PilX N-terminal domain-containing protein n=1 Tax=Paenibacillus aquistagni TaxID=1852522 RepID=UPI000B50F0EF|nr:pilus assembly PilX N-terminal domain-containing protein [Paenibacillus aquistagni]
MLKDERGFALPMVLIFATALTLLGITLLSVSLNQATRTMQQEKREQAFYIAKSGADAVASHIIERFNPVTLDTASIKDLNDHYLKDIPFGAGSFSATLTKDSSTDEVKILSVGKVGGVHNQTALTLAMDAPAETMTHAILSGNNINTNASIVINNGGNVAAKNNINDIPAIHFSGGGKKEPSSSVEFPSPLPSPDVSAWPVLGFSSGMTINKSGRYDSIEVAGSQSFNIVVPDHREMHIVFKNVVGEKVGELIKGELEIKVSGPGNGIVHIYMDELDLTNFLIKNSTEKKIILHVKSSLNLRGSSTLQGVLIFAPSVNYSKVKGSLIIQKGAMVIGDITELTGSITINYDPDFANLIKATRRYVRHHWSGT